MSNYFTELSQIDCSRHVEKKGQFTYLSWPFAIKTLLDKHPDATWQVNEYPLKDVEGTKVPYLHTPLGYFVSVTVRVNSIDRTQIHPVLDNRNKVMGKPDAFNINTSIQRCLVKAIALHGLSLYIYAGEDLPEPVIGDMSGDKVDMDNVARTAKYLKELIDQDDPYVTVNDIKVIWDKLTNDEKIEVYGMMKDKAPDCNKKYSSLLKTHLKYGEDDGI